MVDTNHRYRRAGNRDEREPGAATKALLLKRVKCDKHGIWSDKYVLRGVTAVEQPMRGCWKCKADATRRRPAP